jgi:hypothetical protein
LTWSAGVLKSASIAFAQGLERNLRMNRRSIQTARRAVLATGVMLAAVGCAEWMPFDIGRKREAAREAEASQLWEMTLMAGRYGAMLAQAREILNLPEPKTPPGAGFPTGDLDPAKSRAALADYQVSVAAEFAGDVARACKGRRVAKKVRAHACAQATKLPAELGAPAEPEMSELSARNERVGEFVMPWWNAVCASAPKPKDGTPACPME